MNRSVSKTLPPLDPRAALWGGFVALLILAVLFQTVDWDQTIAAYYWNQGVQPWPGRENFLAWLAYAWGPYPAFVAGSLGGLAFLLSYRVEAWRRWRGPGLFMFLLLALGPGLLVNTLGKALTGRPRPAEVVDFGGFWTFARAGHFGLPGQGRSFPSGHVAMGYYWLSLGFLWKRHRKLGFVLGFLYGAWMSWARMAQGAHFLSDTLFAGVVVYLTAAALSPLIDWQPSPAFWRRPRVLAALGGSAFGLLLISQVVYEERSFLWVTSTEKIHTLGTQRVTTVHNQAPLDKVAVDLSLERGDLTVNFTGQGGDGLMPLRLDEHFWGQGLPGARDDFKASPLAPSPLFTLGPGTLAAGLNQHLQGAWWAVDGHYDLSLPKALLVDARLKTGRGLLTIDSFPLGRQVLLNGDLQQEDLPEGFKAFGNHAWLREGAQPQIALNLSAPIIRFER